MGSSLGLVPRSAQAWIYPEHRDITVEALARLERPQAEWFELLWNAARVGREARYCASANAKDQGTRPECIDLAAWPAISGDHSCSANDLVNGTIPSDWIRSVARIGAETGDAIAKATSASALRNAWANSDLRLERADSRYSRRAVANNAHFLLARAADDFSLYAGMTVASGTEPNAMGIYVRYHVAALRFARAWPSASLEERGELARRILGAEAFAVHFLEDAYSAGHAAGTWGNAADRKGTHDYYSTNGLDAVTWAYHPLNLLGDAHMRPVDRDRSSRAVALSLASVFEATRPDSAAAALDFVDRQWAETAYQFDVCQATQMGEGEVERAGLALVSSTLLDTPRPGNGERAIHAPRFRAEIGPFLAIAAGGRAASASGGFASPNYEPRPVGSLELALRLGAGIEGVVGSSGSLYLQAGYVLETAQVDVCSRSTCTGDVRTDTVLPRVPARSGLNFRLRLPFWIVPGDLLLLAPVLVFTSPHTLTSIATVAAGGGLIPWQANLETAIGTFQIVLGRDVGFTLFGFQGGKDQSVTAVGRRPDGTVQYAEVDFQSIELELPLLEYRPIRSFAAKQTFVLAFQLGYAVDSPSGVEVRNAPGVAPPNLTPAHLVFLRLGFDSRLYF